MICDFCKTNIFESEKLWDYHHRSLETLKDSAKEQCVFCSRLFRDVESSTTSQSKLAWPLYRWTARRPTRIRETQESIVITLRPITGQRGGEDDRIDSMELPERTFYLFPEDDLGAMPSEQALGSSTNSPETWLQISKWMHHCQEHHPQCHRQRAGNRFTPTRLLDIGLPSSSPSDPHHHHHHHDNHHSSSTPPAPIRVVETGPANITNARYATLSHCWGLQPFVQLTPQNHGLLTTRGVEWHQLPRNFQQAIEVARRLPGVPYIWIDSLCIVQGAAGDFHSEASRMHQVYRNSFCNIVAADAGDSSGGLFRRREARDVLPARYRCGREEKEGEKKKKTRSRICGGRAWRVVPKTLWEDELLGTRVYTRGWVFQERMLAPRLVHFARAQVFWDCPALSACEAFPAGLPAALDAGGKAATDRHWRARLQDAGTLRRWRPLAGAADDSLETFWAAAVRNYTACDLTNGKDKLVAVWGIAKLVRDALGEGYAAGLWEGRLEEQLAWRVEAPAPRGRGRVWPLRAPSWSWASLDGVVLVQDRISAERCYTVTDHSGRAIAFDLGQGKRAKEEERRNGSWGEQFRLWDVLQKEKLEKREKRKSVQKRLQQNEGREEGRDGQLADQGDEPPVLRTDAIAMQAHIGRARFVRRAAEKWTLDIPGADPDQAILDAFLDEEPDNVSHESYFMILAASRSGSSDEDVDEGYYNEDEEDEQPTRPPKTFSGVGVILNSTGKKNHFYRTGALHFRGLDYRTLREMEKKYLQEACDALDRPSKGKGHKIWLR